MLYNAQCQCGHITFKVDLPEDLSEYSPRQCDCDFCVPRKISYLSDPQGILFIDKKDFANTKMQGDKIAEFICCPKCDDVIAAIFKTKDEFKGAANANLLAEKYLLQDPITVSPKTLAKDEKIKRWQNLWMNVVKNQN